MGNKKYNPLYTNKYNAIPGVDRTQGLSAGTTVGIGSCTHGGEITGLQVIDEIKKLIENKHIQLVKGDLYFLLNNREAYKKFIDSREANDTGEVLHQKVVDARYIEENLNRCCTPKNIKTGTSVEIERVRELLPILQQCNYFMDIHSTYGKGNPSMLISSSKGQHLGSVFNMDEQLYGIPEVQVGRPLISVVEDSGGIGIGMETGYELDATGKRVGTENILRLLRHLGMIAIDDPSVFEEYNLKKKNKQNKQYHIYDKVIVNHPEIFSPNEFYQHGDFIGKDEIVARERINDQHCNRKKVMKSSQAMLPLPPKTYFEGQEYMFLAEATGPIMYPSLEKVSTGISSIFNKYIPQNIGEDDRKNIEYILRESITQAIKMIEPHTHTSQIYLHLKSHIHKNLSQENSVGLNHIGNYMRKLKKQNRSIQLHIKNFFHKNDDGLLIPNIIND